MRSMINYTEHVRRLMSDIVLRVPRLSFLDMNRILVFARAGRADREGPYADVPLRVPSTKRARLLLLAR